MPIIRINGEPIIETTNQDQQSNQCPPGGLQDDVASDGPGGEEVHGEYNLGGERFISPRAEIDASAFESMPQDGGIREINLLDDYLFYTSNNLFITNAQGDSEFASDIFSSHSRRAYRQKLAGISNFEISRKNRNSEIEIISNTTDKFRVLTNRFWCLEGTTQQPIQEVWVNDRNKDIGEFSYNIEFIPPENGAISEKIKIEFNDFDAQEASIESMESALSGIFQIGKEFIDSNVSIPQPILSSEVGSFITDNTYVLDFQTTILKKEIEGKIRPAVEIDPDIAARPEFFLKSLYREYYRKIRPDPNDPCELLEDKVQKFISSNSAVMNAANSDDSLLNNSLTAISNAYVTITFKRPRDPDDVVSNFFSSLHDTEYDKYLLEIFTGLDNGSHTQEYNKIIITDEKTPNNFPQRQASRVNDQFFVGFVEGHKSYVNWFTYGQHSSPDTRDNRAEHVISRVQEYPLKFTNCDNIEHLKQAEPTNVSNFYSDSLVPTLSSITRKYSDIFAGKKAASIIIGYKIEKRSPSTGRLIQTFYVMERPQPEGATSNELKFIDTQVHYGSTYKYRIYSIALVASSGYEFQNPEFDPEASPPTMTSTITLTQKPRLYLVPFYEKIVAVADLPPLPPEVAFLPDKEDPKKLKIAFNHNVGFRIENPISILGADSSVISKMRNSQNNPAQGLEYYSDTIPESYEMFMETEPPRGYFSFGSSYHIPTEGNLAVFREQNNIQPNKDYYFTFRSREAAGISNPTPIYKFRMVDSPNGVFMVLEEYDPYAIEQEFQSLSFQKTLKISPSARQKAIRYPAGTDFSSREFALSAPELDTISIGPEQDSIWGKKYKFRITSKKTGRKLDLNATFNQKTFHNTQILSLVGGCRQEPRYIEQVPPPTDDCLNLRGFTLPTLDGQAGIEKSITCTLDKSERYRWKYADYLLDLYNLNDRGKNIFDFCKDLNPVFEYQPFPEFTLQEATLIEENNSVEPSNPEFAIFGANRNEQDWFVGFRSGTISDKKWPDRIRVNFNDICLCEENQDKFIKMIPELAFQQYELAATGQDYFPIFDTGGEIPPFLMEGIMSNSNWYSAQDGNLTEYGRLQAARLLRQVQEAWWAGLYDVPNENSLIQSYLPKPITIGYQLSNIHSNPNFEGGWDRLNVYQLSDGRYVMKAQAYYPGEDVKGAPLYDSKRPEDICMAIVKKTIKSLILPRFYLNANSSTTFKYRMYQAQDLLEKGLEQSMAEDDTMSAPKYYAVLQAYNEMQVSLEEDPLEDRCPQNRDDLPDPKFHLRGVKMTATSNFTDYSSIYSNVTIQDYEDLGAEIPVYELNEGEKLWVYPGFVGVQPDCLADWDNPSIKFTVENPDSAELTITPASSTTLTYSELTTKIGAGSRDGVNGKSTALPQLPQTGNGFPNFIIEAKSDAIVEVDEEYDITFTTSNHPNSVTPNTEHPNFNGLSTFVRVRIKGTELGINVTPEDQEVEEDNGANPPVGNQVAYTISLSHPTTADVTINLSAIDNTTRVTRTAASVTFPAGSTPATTQTVTYTTTPNEIYQGDVTETIEFSVDAGCTDPVFQDLIGRDPVVRTLTIKENDQVGFTVTPEDKQFLAEDGGTQAYNIQLLSEPTAPVTINLSDIANDDRVERDFDSVTFTAGSPKSTIKTITYTGLANTDDDHNVTENITFSVGNGSATEYIGVASQTRELEIVDNDPFAIYVEPSSRKTISENGGLQTYNVYLSHTPTSNVTINITKEFRDPEYFDPIIELYADAGLAITLQQIQEAFWVPENYVNQDVSSLTFTPSDSAGTFKQVTFDAIDNDHAQGDQVLSIDFAVAEGSQSDFVGLSLTREIMIEDDDNAGFSVVAMGDTRIAENNGEIRYKLTLNSPPSPYPDGGQQVLTFAVADLDQFTGPDDPDLASDMDSDNGNKSWQLDHKKNLVASKREEDRNEVRFELASVMIPKNATESLNQNTVDINPFRLRKGFSFQPGQQVAYLTFKPIDNGAYNDTIDVNVHFWINMSPNLLNLTAHGAWVPSAGPQNGITKTFTIVNDDFHTCPETYEQFTDADGTPRCRCPEDKPYEVEVDGVTQCVALEDLQCPSPGVEGAVVEEVVIDGAKYCRYYIPESIETEYTCKEGFGATNNTQSRTMTLKTKQPGFHGGGHQQWFQVFHKDIEKEDTLDINTFSQDLSDHQRIVRSYLLEAKELLLQLDFPGLAMTDLQGKAPFILGELEGFGTKQYSEIVTLNEYQNSTDYCNACPLTDDEIPVSLVSSVDGKGGNLCLCPDNTDRAGAVPHTVSHPGGLQQMFCNNAPGAGNTAVLGDLFGLFGGGDEDTSNLVTFQFTISGTARYWNSLDNLLRLLNEDSEEIRSVDGTRSEEKYVLISDKKHLFTQESWRMYGSTMDGFLPKLLSPAQRIEKLFYEHGRPGVENWEISPLYDLTAEIENWVSGYPILTCNNNQANSDMTNWSQAEMPDLYAYNPEQQTRYRMEFLPTGIIVNSNGATERFWTTEPEFYLDYLGTTPIYGKNISRNGVRGYTATNCASGNRVTGHARYGKYDDGFRVFETEWSRFLDTQPNTFVDTNREYGLLVTVNHESGPKTVHFGNAHRSAEVLNADTREVDINNVFIKNSFNSWRMQNFAGFTNSNLERFDHNKISEFIADPVTFIQNL